MRRTLVSYAAGVFAVILVVHFLPCAARAQDAAKVYKARCELCHAADGSGNSPSGKALKAKDLHSDEVQKMSDAELADAIAKGKGKMPAFGSKLSPETIKSLVAYIRQMAKK